MQSELAWRKRSAINRIRTLLRTEGGRYVDCSIELIPVEKDEEGGVQVIPGLPGVWRCGESHYFGGVYDTVRHEWDHSRKGDPIVWYCSKEQLEVILHDRGEIPEPYLLTYGAEGSGKTQVLAMWMLIRIILAVGLSSRPLYAGLVAPTNDRLKIARRILMEKVPIDTPTDRRDDSWGTYFASESEIRFHFGITVECRAAVQHSAASGSPLQGRTWFIAAVDEDQDVVELGRDPDIESRLRGIKDTERASTATAKDSSTWKRVRDERLASGDWTIRRLPYWTNAFEWAARWAKMARNMSKRDAKRRMMAEDVAPELAVYYNWDRARNICPLPDFGTDVTEAIVHGHGYTPYSRSDAIACLVVAHDPGLIFQTSIYIRAIWVKKMVRWYVVGEFITGPGRMESEGKSLTARQHAKALVLDLRSRFELNYAAEKDDPIAGQRRALVLCDPHERGEKRPDEDTYHSFQAEGLDIFKADEGTIKRRTRQDMVNALMEDSTGETRLYCATDEEGRELAPTVVMAFETLEKDAAGESERDKKGVHDITHPAVCVGYGCWPFEREAVTELTHQFARRAV